jgi:hypothetical protein
MKREESFVDETGLIKDVSMKWEDTLPVYSREEPSPVKPFLKFRTAEKGLGGK